MARKKIQSATDQRPFIMVYQDFLESDLLDNCYQKLIYIYLKKFADSNNQCFPSIKKLSSLTKIGSTKIKQTLAELEEKGVISKVNRNRSDGGKTSNLYTLYDFAEIWKVGSSKDVTTVIEEVSEAKMIAALKEKGYIIIKEKEPDPSHADQSNDEPSTKLNPFDMANTTSNLKRSQVECYTLEQIKKKYEYDIMVKDNPLYQEDIDIVMNILYDTLNCTKQTIRVDSEDKPKKVVIERLEELNYESILHSIRKYRKATDRIISPIQYMLTVLYKAATGQFSLDIQNEVSYNMKNRNLSE